MGFSLSTSWNAFRYTDSKGMVFEIEALGFNELELSFNLTPAMVGEIAELVKENKVRVSSLHNYCPIPEGIAREAALPDCYSIASSDIQQRLTAIKYTKRTIDAAKLLNAKAIVLHSGRVEITDTTRRLMELCSQGLTGSVEFKKLRDKTIKERQKNAAPFVENVLMSLDELNRYAVKQGMRLGVETRFYYREIPSFEEFGLIFSNFSGGNIFYWHDTGHAQVTQHLGLGRHKDYLDAYGKYLIGVHLHDVSACRDHLAPSKGELDFSLLRGYLKDETIKVIEAHHPATGEELKAAKEYLTKVFYGKI